MTGTVLPYATPAPTCNPLECGKPPPSVFDDADDRNDRQRANPDRFVGTPVRHRIFIRAWKPCEVCRPKPRGGMFSLFVPLLLLVELRGPRSVSANGSVLRSEDDSA